MVSERVKIFHALNCTCVHQVRRPEEMREYSENMWEILRVVGVEE